MSVSAADTEILRRLAAEVADIAALPVQQQTIANWKTLNSLKRAKPMVLAYDIPWQELNVNDELTLRTTDEFARGLETNLQRILYQWRHFPGDMVVEDVVYCPLAIRETGFGIQEQVEIVETDATSAVVSRDFTPQIDNEEDVLKIKFPEVSHDVAATEATFSAMSEIFDGVLRVEKRGWIWGGIVSWDELIRWWDVQKAMLDLVLRPELVHLALERLTAANVRRLEQLEEQGLLACNANCIAGSGGYGYTDELPAPGFNAAHVRPVDMWGSATSQIFSEVSPAMHEEFALRYERPWIERFGLSYYGCCEQLHHKVDILRSIKNLRKISMSAWADAQRGAEAVGTDYVFSHKPNPAIVAEHSWRPELARQRYREILEITRGNVVEIILKDISTVRYEPQRLWDWVHIASEEAENFAS